MQPELPLYHLFQVLRNEGFSLGTEQYLLLIKALHHKKYLLDLEIIRRTCHALWTNSKEETWIFDRHFDLLILAEKQVLAEIEKETDSLEKDKKEDAAKTSKTSSTPPRSTSKEASPKTDSPEKTTFPEPSKTTERNTPPILPNHFQPSQMSGHERFLLDSSVSPITLRQMQQSWRYLRKWKREGARTELDIAKTFEEVAKKGFFTAPAKSAPRVNIVDLLLLVDRNGSMLPFHGLVDELIHSALHGGRFDKATCLYFHDYPIKYFYRQPQLIEEVDLKRLKNKLDVKRTVVMVISDAGAARRTYSEKRVERTRQFQEYLKENTSNFVWLNPMPKERWEGCSAEDIAEFFPMYEVNQQGLSQAIDVLRGKKGSHG